MTQIDPRPQAPHHILARTGFSTAPPASRWIEAYRARLTVGDLVVVIAAVVPKRASSMVSYSIVSAVLVVLWALALTAFHTRESRIVGSGPEEYRRIAHASFALFGTAARWEPTTRTLER
ncbi:MAG: hypothetical protein EON52_23865 [Actinomycetales bacterium]|nr:MAG: hypothetical protein EON52_23865 [Actinomycetales bacterium]